MYDYLSECNALKLKKFDSDFETYGHVVELGRTYSFDNDHYGIGGKITADNKIEYSSHAKSVATGSWLPSDSHLWHWLQRNHIDVTIKWDAQKEKSYVDATDCTNGETYQGRHIDLLFSLFKLVYKICKSGKHKVIPIEVTDILLPECHVSFEEMQRLKSVGFSFPDYEHFLNEGMVYFFDNNTYVIGSLKYEYTEHDQLVSESGCWLPDDSQFWAWLYRNDFDVTYHWSDSDQCFYLSATDSLTGQDYSASGKVLVHTLSELIYKICKSDMRCYVPESYMRLKILRD